MTNWPVEKLKELIPNYLRGELSGEEEAAFKDGLAKYAELRSELEEMRRLSVGLEIIDRLSIDHPNSQDIVSFVYQPQQFSRESLTKIEEHLKQCAQCREEYELSRQTLMSIGQESAQVVAESRTMFERLLSFLFPPQLVLRPVYAYIAIALLAIPAYLGVRSLDVANPDVTVYSIHVSGDRGTKTDNVFDIAEGSGLIRLQFPSFPARTGYHYNVNISDMSGRPVISWYALQISGNTSLDVPVTILSGDTYTIVFEEIDSLGKKTDTFAPQLLRIKHSE